MLSSFKLNGNGGKGADFFIAIIAASSNNLSPESGRVQFFAPKICNQ